MSVPILLVTGFLGAGKTTLVNRLLRGDHGMRIAAIVNDFGSINIDAALIDRAAEGVIGLKNGCICCSLSGDLLRTLKSVLKVAPDLIVIEASGVADPAGIVQSLIDPVIWSQASLEGIVCVVDGMDAAVRADDPLWQAQLRASDMACLSKTEGLTPQACDALRARLSVGGARHVLDMDEPLPIEALLIDAPRARPGMGRAPLRDDRFVHLEWHHDGAVSMPAFQEAVGALAPSLLRAKGLLAFSGREGRFVFQFAGQRATLAPAPEGSGTGCDLVLIGERATLDLDAARARLGGLAAPGSPTLADGGDGRSRVSDARPGSGGADTVI